MKNNLFLKVNHINNTFAKTTLIINSNSFKYRDRTLYIFKSKELSKNWLLLFYL